MRNESMPVFKKGEARISGNRTPFMSEYKAALYDLFLQVLLSMLSAWVFVHLFTTAFGLTVSEIPFIFFSFVLSVLMAFLVRGKKVGIFILGTVMVAGIIFLAVNWSKVVAECSGLYDRLISTFGERYGFVNNMESETERSYSVTWVMICFSFVPIWQTSYTYGKKMHPVLLIAFLLVPLYIDFAAGAGPSILTIILTAVDVAALFITCRAEFMNRDAEIGALDSKKVRFVTCFAGALGALAVVLFSAFLLFPVLKDTIDKLRDRYSAHFLTDMLADMADNPFNISKDGLNQGDLSDSDGVVRNGEAVFTVTFEKASQYPSYLRGFTGDAYTGEKWTTSEEILPEDCMPDELGFNVFDGNVPTESSFYRNPLIYYQALHLNELQHPAESYNTLIINKNSFDHIAYLPYFIRGRIKNMSTSMPYAIEKDLYVKGTDEEMIEVPYFMYANLAEVLQYINGNASASGTVNGDLSVPVNYMDAEALLELLNGHYGANTTLDAIYAKPYDEYVLTDVSGVEMHVRLKEACIDAYETYVEDICKRTPESVLLDNAVSEIRAAYGIESGISDAAAIVVAVQKYLAANCIYDLNPGKTEREKDFVESFLFEKKTGYCVHFAAAGAVLLRKLGLPTRYVEGYLVPAASAGQTINVTDYEAHAWCEIFIKGFGWFPVDMTPVDEPEEKEPETVPPEQITPEQEHEEPTTPPPVEEPPELPQEEEKPSLWWLWVLLSLLVLSAIAYVLWRHLFRIVPLDELSEGKNNRETYLAVYDRLRKKIFEKDAFFCADDTKETLKTLYPEIPEAELEKLQRLAKEAYYSENAFSDESVVWIYDYYEKKAFARPVSEKGKALIG